VVGKEQKNVKIGVLGLQGVVREHARSIKESGAEAVVIKK
jgi:5'-phosphate synthase pdxT subunit